MSISDDKPLLHPNEDGHLVGKNPLSLDIFLLEEAGHTNIPIGRVIQKSA